MDARSERHIIHIDVRGMTPEQAIAAVQRAKASYRTAPPTEVYPPESALVPPAFVEEQAPVLTVLGLLAALLCVLAALLKGLFR